MMKKVTYVLTMIFAVALMSTSCCKDDPVVPTGPMTLSELEGAWTSTQYEWNGTTYDVCGDLTSSLDTEVQDGVVMLISVDFVSNGTSLSDNCSDYYESGINLEYDSQNQKIELKKSGIWLYRFNVVSYDRESPATLVLELKQKNVALDIPLNGVYTLQ